MLSEFCAEQRYCPYFAKVLRAGRAQGIKGNRFIALLHPEKRKMNLTPPAESRNETHNSLSMPTL